MVIRFDEYYIPTEKQSQFHRASQRYKLYGGAMGGGKSVALCAESIQLCLDYPGNRGYVCRKYNTVLKKTTMQTFFEVCPPALIKSYNKVDQELNFINGSKIWFGDLEDVDKLKSMNLGFFAIDEASEVPYDRFLLLDSRLRLNVPNIRYYGLLATNPEPGWVKERFVDKQLPDHIFVPALPKDNRYLPEDYVANLRKNYPEEWVKKYLEGNWSVFEGQVYKEFDRSVHVIDPEPIPEEWPRFRTIDFGYRNPFVCLWIAIDYDDNVYVYDEHYRAEMKIKEHADVILRKSGQHKFTDYGDHEDQQSIAELEDYGIYCLPVDKEKKLGIDRVKLFLHQKRLFIFSNCVNLLREFELYRYPELDTDHTSRLNREEKEDPIKDNDHALDALRYLISTYFKPKLPKKKKPISYTDPLIDINVY
jgi:PBSX family phage terminase large subunit